MTEERSVLIAGCSDGGIGLALALAFVRRGFHVFVTARTIANMSKLHNLENVTLLSLDVVDSAQIKATVAAVSKQTGGKLDYLISNAGQNRFMPLLDERIEDAKSLYDINFWGPLQLVQAFSPLLIKSKGTIVFVASVSGYLNVPWQGVFFS
jgi:1-acylglycerone phosphate reductase